jgi:hypothetical protein
MVVMLLAVYAIRKRRQKSVDLRKRWAQEEGDWHDGWPDDKRPP